MFTHVEEEHTISVPSVLPSDMSIDAAGVAHVTYFEGCHNSGPFLRIGREINRFSVYIVVIQRGYDGLFLCCLLENWMLWMTAGSAQTCHILSEIKYIILNIMLRIRAMVLLVAFAALDFVFPTLLRWILELVECSEFRRSAQKNCAFYQNYSPN